MQNPANQGHAIKELQGKKTSVVTGGAAATDLPMAGVGANDSIGSVIMFASGTPSDVTSEASISSAGNIQLSTTNSTGNQLVVEWYPQPTSV